MSNIIKKSITKTNQEYWLSEKPAANWKDLPLFTLREIEYMNTRSNERIDQIYAQRKANHAFRFLPEPEAAKTLYVQRSDSFSCSHCGTSGVVEARSLDNYVSVYRCSCPWFGPDFKVSRPIKTWLEHENPTFTPRYWDVTASAQPVKVIHTSDSDERQKLCGEAIESLKNIFGIFDEPRTCWQCVVPGLEAHCIVSKEDKGHCVDGLPVFSPTEFAKLKQYPPDQVGWIYAARIDGLDIVWA